MKKLLVSVVALLVATLLFSQDDTVEDRESANQDNKIELVSDTKTAS